MGKDNWLYWTFRVAQHGGYWEEDHSDIKGFLEERVVECLCQVMGVHPDWAWPQWVQGPFASVVVSRLGKGFTDAHFLRYLDGSQTHKYIQFSCGRVYNTDTHEVWARAEWHVVAGWFVFLGGATTFSASGVWVKITTFWVKGG